MRSDKAGGTMFSSHVKKGRERESGLPRGDCLDFDDVEASSGIFVESCKSPC